MPSSSSAKPDGNDGEIASGGSAVSKHGATRLPPAASDVGSTRIPALIPPRVGRSLAIAYSLFITIAIWPSPIGPVMSRVIVITLPSGEKLIRSSKVAVVPSVAAMWISPTIASPFQRWMPVRLTPGSSFGLKALLLHGRRHELL